MDKHMNPMYAYGASKAMAQYMVRRIHFECPDVVAFAVDPGQVPPFSEPTGLHRHTDQ